MGNVEYDSHWGQYVCSNCEPPIRELIDSNGNVVCKIPEGSLWKVDRVLRTAYDCKEEMFVAVFKKMLV